MTQPELFPDQKTFGGRYTSQRRHATPRPTSRQAYDSVQTDMRVRQGAVLKCLKVNGPVTLEKLVFDYHFESSQDPFKYPPQSDSGIRTRCSELVKMGLVRDTGRTERTASGRNAVVWEAV